MADEVPLLFGPHMRSEIVVVTVGQTSVKYQIHKSFLIAKSAFFSAAFRDDGFLESGTGELHLTDETPEAFELFLTWLYRGSLTAPKDPAAEENLLKLYVMADKFCLEDLQNMVMDTLRGNAFGRILRRPTVEYVYENTREGSMIRKFVANGVAFDFIHGIYGPRCEEAAKKETGRYFAKQYFKRRADIEGLIEENGNFAIDAFRAMRRYGVEPQQERQHPCETVGCKYHEHISTPQLEI